MKEFFKKHYGNIICVAVSLILCIVVTAYRYGFNTPDSEGFLKALCDGTFVSGILVFLVGLLIVVSDAGAFDAIAFGIYTLGTRVTHKKERFEERKTYYEFQVERHKDKKGNRTMLIVGGVFLALSLVLTLIFMNIYR